MRDAVAAFLRHLRLERNVSPHTLRAYAASGVLLVTVPGLTGTGVAFPGVPAGTYELELLGVNAAGVSAPSNRITLTVP